MIDMAQWLVGDIATVSAELPVFVERPGVEGQELDPANDAALPNVVFCGGAIGTIHVSAVAHLGDRGQEMEFILHGENGTLEAVYNSKDLWAVRGASAAEKEIHTLTIPNDIPQSGDPRRFWLELPVGPRLFIDSIVNDQPVSPTFYDGLRAQEVIEAALRSHKNGEKVALAQSAPA